MINRSDSPTLEDVARLAKVSTATISRSLNTPDKVASKTRDRIQSAIDELGYTPNFGGRVLASNKSNTVGAVIPTMSNAMFASGVQAFQEVLAEAGVTLLVASSGYNAKNELQQIRTLLAQGADGLLLIGTARPRETREFLQLRKVPHVISWCFRPGKTHLYAGFDNAQAAYNMTMKVLEHGHRRIAIVAGHVKDNDRARNRVNGIKRAVRDFGRRSRILEIIETGYFLERGGDAFEQLMCLPVVPTAIICGNDVLAAGATIRARQLGIDIPGSVSVTGFDDIGLARAACPALTTVRVPQVAMGQAAARLLLQLLRFDTRPASIEFASEIIMRDSLAPPA